MSLGVYPQFERPISEDGFESLGETLAAHFIVIDEIALEGGLTPLTAFADNRPIPDDFDGDPDELVEVMGEWTEWFDAEIGACALGRLADHIAELADVRRPQDRDEIVVELRELSRVLSIAAEQGIRFRLELS